MSAPRNSVFARFAHREAGMAPRATRDDDVVVTTMCAWRVLRPGPISTRPLERSDVEIPRPGLGERLVAVRACGVCLTDLHVAEGDLPVHRPGVIPGHEVVAEVIDVGAGADGGFAVGDRVGVAWLRHTCGRCKFCIR